MQLSPDNSARFEQCSEQAVSVRISDQYNVSPCRCSSVTARLLNGCAYNAGTAKLAPFADQHASGRVTRWIETAEEMCCPLDPLNATSGNTSQAVRTVYCTVIPVIQ